jgi:hypothetical protein
MYFVDIVYAERRSWEIPLLVSVFCGTDFSNLCHTAVILPKTVILMVSMD